MRKILTALVALISLLSAVPMVAPTTGTDTKSVTASVGVLPYCDLQVDPSAISFGILIPSQTSATGTTTLSMPHGNVPTTPTISGIGWVGTDSSSHTMDVGQTHWGVSVVNPPTTALTGSGVSVGHQISHGVDVVVNLNVAIPDGQPADSKYTQAITFEISCDTTTTTTLGQ